MVAPRLFVGHTVFLPRPAWHEAVGVAGHIRQGDIVISGVRTKTDASDLLEDRGFKGATATHFVRGLMLRYTRDWSTDVKRAIEGGLLDPDFPAVWTWNTMCNGPFLVEVTTDGPVRRGRWEREKFVTKAVRL